MRTVKTNLVLLFSIVAVVFASCSRTPAVFQSAPAMELVNSGPQYERTDDLAAAEAIEMRKAETIAAAESNNELMVIEPANAALDQPVAVKTSRKNNKLGTVSANGNNSRKVATASKNKKAKFEYKGGLMASLANMLYDRVEAKRAEGGKYATMSTADIFAIVSLSTGVLAIITFYGVFLFGIAGIVFGVLALNRGTSRRGMAIAGIVLGALAFLFWILLFLFVFGFFGAAVL